MIDEMPNVDRARMAELYAMIERCASRYEYRLDGSSLWEGRVQSAWHEKLVALLAGDDDPASEDLLARQQSYPALVIPESYCLVAGNRLLGYWVCPDDQAIIGLQDTDVFVTQHPTASTFDWELQHIHRMRDTGEIVRPRELMTDFNFALLHRQRLVNSGNCWR